MTPEGKVKERVKKLLKKYAATTYWHMPVQNGMGNPTLDFVGCSLGRFFSIETKAPGGKLTARQVLTIKEMRAAGGTVFVIDDDGSGEHGGDEYQTLELLELWLSPTMMNSNAR